MEEKYQKLHDMLFQETVKKYTGRLEPAQMEKLNKACWKAIQDNEGSTFEDLMIATQIYLNVIVDFPDPTL